MDRTTLLMDLGALTAPAELVGKVQELEGSSLDKIFVGIEMLYAFHDQLDADGQTLLANLTSYSTANGWQTDRIAAITAGTADPVVSYRDDGKDWRTPVDFAALKAARRAAVNVLKDSHENMPAPTPKGAVDNDDSSKVKLNGAVTMAMLAAQQQQPFSVDWTMADNSVVTCDGPTIMLIGEAAGQYVSQVHDRARALKALIDGIVVTDGDVASAVAALNAIDITYGWPASTTNPSS